MGRDYILLGEDNPDDEALVLHALHAGGSDARVHVVRDGAHALRFLFEPGGAVEAGDLPGLILLDLNLGKPGGLEVLIRLRADSRTNNLPVALLISSPDPAAIEKAYRAGANLCIQKPDTFDAFVDAIRQVLRLWPPADAPPE
ncbi:MAG: response regulator [Acidobacteria bacterium]|nr:response regulator [Acidobacteriota bacterium]